MTWTKKHHEKIGFQLQISQCFPTLNFWKDLSPQKKGLQTSNPKNLWTFVALGFLLPSEQNLDAKGLREGETSGLCFIGSVRFDVHRVLAVESYTSNALVGFFLMGELDVFFFCWDRDVFSNVCFLVGDEWFDQPAVGFGMHIYSIEMWMICEPCSKPWLGVLKVLYIWGIMLPSYMEIIICHWAIVRTPYQPTSTMKCHKGLHTAQICILGCSQTQLATRKLTLYRLRGDETQSKPLFLPLASTGFSNFQSVDMNHLNEVNLRPTPS